MNATHRRAAFGGLSLLLLQGCGVNESYSTSSPPDMNVLPPHELKRSPYELNIQDAGEFQFTITPFNARFTSGIFWLMLLPIPQGSPSFDNEVAIRFDKRSTAADPPFLVEIGILTPRGDLSFDPSKVRLEVNGERIAPSGMIELPEKQCARLGHRYMLASCHLTEVPAAGPLETVRIGGGRVKFLWLSFDRQPPAPETPFAVELNGISLGGRGAPAARVPFTVKEVAHSDSMP
jgi:hypothetical protein